MLSAFEVLTAALGIVMALAYYPQAYKIIKNRSSRGVSLLSYVILAIGTFVWTVYGFYVRDAVIIVSFLVSVIGSWSVLALALYYRSKA